MEKLSQPWYETNRFWGCFGAGMGIVLTVIPSVKHDLRWLLLLALVFFGLAIWMAFRPYSKGKVFAALAIFILVCAGIYKLNSWLNSTASSGEPMPEALADRNQHKESAAPNAPMVKPLPTTKPLERRPIVELNPIENPGNRRKSQLSPQTPQVPLIGPGAQVNQNSEGAINSPNIISGGPVTINPVSPPPCKLTKDQHDTLVAFLKASGPPHSTAVRHQGGSTGSQQCADELSAAIQDAGWTVNPRPKFLIQERETIGIRVMVEDTDKAPACAITLQQAFKEIHVDAPGIGVPALNYGNEPCEIFVGVQK